MCIIIAIIKNYYFCYCCYCYDSFYYYCYYYYYYYDDDDLSECVLQDTWVIPVEQDRIILPAQLANHSKGVILSCPLKELAI